MTIPTSETLLNETTAFCEAEFLRLAERCEPLTQEIANAIRDAAMLRLVSRIKELEYLHDAASRKTKRIGDAIEVSNSVRQIIKNN